MVSFLWPGRKARGVDELPISGARALALTSMSRRVSTLIRKAELRDVDGPVLTSTHGLRATGISLMVAAGVPLWIVKEIAGHSDIRVTQASYAGSPDIEHLRSGAAVFNATPPGDLGSRNVT